MLVSTSRHVTQGMVDVIGEKWNATAKTLTGVSEIVGNDPYELRVAGLQEDGKKWRLVSATVSVKDQAAGVLITSKTPDTAETGWCRVGIDSNTGQAVHWTLNFAAD